MGFDVSVYPDPLADTDPQGFSATPWDHITQKEHFYVGGPVGAQFFIYLSYQIQYLAIQHPKVS